VAFRNGTDGYESLEQALRDVVDSDVITLCPGTFDESVTTRSSFALESSAGPEVTSLHGTSTRPVLEVATGTVEVSGLSFAYGGGLNIDGERFGGAIYVADGAGLVFRSSRAIDNTADFGGAIYLGASGTLDLADAVLEHNEAFTDGGAVFAVGATTVRGTHLWSNTSARSGGGLYADWDSTIDITDSHFAENSSHSGGGIYAEHTVTLTASTLTANVAEGHGGGIDATVLNMTDSTLSSNTSEDSGGGLRVDTLDARNCIISDNSARSGGGVHAMTAALDATSVSGNSATTTGAGVHFHGTMSLVDSEVISNTSGTDGGGLHATFAHELTLTRSSIENNHAAQGGGLHLTALGWGAGEMSCDTTSVIRGNAADQGSAEQRGGGMHAYGLIVSGCSFQDNSADQGGGLWFTGELSDVDLTGNAATTEGGALFISGSTGSKLTRTTILNNTAGIGASALKDWGDGAEMVSSTVTGNTSPDGVVMELDVYDDDYTLTVHDTQFDNGSLIRLSAWDRQDIDTPVPGPTFTCTPTGC